MMLRFVGTRGNIAIRSRRHQWHSALLLSGRSGRLLIDCGEDWLARIDQLRPTAIVVTHGHSDHASGLRRGAPCPVYATPETWRLMERWPITDRRVLTPRRAVWIGGFRVQPYPVEHSLNAPAVGFAISARNVRVFYLPDVAAIANPERTLNGVDLYVGDGAVLVRSLVRQRGAVRIGHASVALQLDWCRMGGIRRAVFTHCGSGIVRSSARVVNALVRSLGHDRGISARVAHDGLAMQLRASRSGKE